MDSVPLGPSQTARLRPQGLTPNISFIPPSPQYEKSLTYKEAPPYGRRDAQYDAVQITVDRFVSVPGSCGGGPAPQVWSPFNNFVKVISGASIGVADVNVKGGPGGNVLERCGEGYEFVKDEMRRSLIGRSTRHEE